MSYLTRQIILLLSKISEALKEHNETTDQIRKDTHEQAKIHKEALEKILAAHNESERNHSVKQDRHYDVQNSNRWAAWCMFVATIGAVGAATWYACLTNTLVKTTQKQLNETRDARRPWVGIDGGMVTVSPQPSFFFGIPPHEVPNPTILIDISYSLKNFGSSPALHETDIPGAIAVDPTKSIPPTDEINFQCGYAEALSTNKGAANPGAGTVLLPGAAQHSGFNVTPILLPGQKHLERFWIFVCITYQDGWSKKIHHSKYWYMTTHQNLGSGPPITVLGHPQWSFVPIVGVNSWGAEAD